MTQLPYADPGRASFENVDTYTNAYLLGGTHPPLADALGLTQKPSTSLVQFAVATRDTDGTIIKAVWDADNPFQACLVVAQAATAAASPASNVQCFYQGNFNIDALVWDASFDTDAKKLAAFVGAPSPTQIVASKR